MRPQWASGLGEDHTVRLDALAAMSDTRADARRRDRDGRERACRPPSCPDAISFSSAFAGALAYRRGIKHLVAGMCETDYLGLSGLPRRHDQGDAACAQPRHGAPLRDPYAVDVDRQGGDLRARAPDRRATRSSTCWSRTPTPAISATARSGTTGATAAGSARPAGCGRKVSRDGKFATMEVRT